MRYSTFALALSFAASTIAIPQDVSQIEDGQPQVGAVDQIEDGQIQAATSGVAQIPDGQIQAPVATSTAAPVSQIADGQIVAPESTPEAAPVSQIDDGQIQVGTAPAPSGVASPTGNATAPTTAPSPSPFTGAASLASWSKEIVVAAIGAAAGFALL